MSLKLSLQCIDITVNSEILARALFSRNFAKFRENKTFAIWQYVTLPFTDVKSRIASIAIVSFNVIREIKFSGKFLNLHYLLLFCFPLLLLGVFRHSSSDGE